ncbi:MAG: leucine--tRNA ligase, partial [Holosporales bacterium]|nr:leucine--tRNA ligase [Holosporales bacterium]
MTNASYNFKLIQDKWQRKLTGFAVANSDVLTHNAGKETRYILEMLPYPSGKLHMGHVRNYTIGDVVARRKRMEGYNVIHPIGWDSFGMPAENAAMSNGSHPKTWTVSNIRDMSNQLKSFGYMYDWARELSTCDPEYYHQEQRIFLDFYKLGIIYRKKSYVNWDPVDQTVLANEQVIDGKGWRSGAIVEKKFLEQWSVKVTAYAEELLDGLEKLRGTWPDKVLKMQENWIGKSSGAIINFSFVDRDGGVEVFTTRPDTLFGASFIAISPDHEIAKSLVQSDDSVRAFVDECSRMSTTEEAIEKAEKMGIFTGLHVKHPVKTGEVLPVYIANFVIIDYGTGAVFGCPAHDERDFEFAIKYGLHITPVIDSDEQLPYTGNGPHINSEFLDGLYFDEAKEKMIRRVEELGVGQRKVTYRLRDWLVSRQRYWGCPIPIIKCPRCGDVPADGPVTLPDDVKFDGYGN